MPVTVVLDMVQDARIDLDWSRATLVRTGYMKGIDTTLSPEQIMAAAVDTSVASGMPLKGSPHPYYPFAILQRYQFTTRPGVNNKLYFKLLYETPEGRNPAGDSLFTLERHRQLIQTQTEKHPKDWSDLNFAWKNPDNANQRIVDVASLGYLQPHLSIVATGYIIGALPAGYENAFGKVNATAWQGYPVGYWLYLGADDSTKDFGNSHTVRLEFLTRKTEDWSSYSKLRDPRTGKFLPVLDTEALTLKNHPYEYGKFFANGMIKAGLYDTDEFNSTFGF